MMQADSLDDSAENSDDPNLRTIDDIKAKYDLADNGGMWESYKEILKMNYGMMKAPMNPDQFCWQGDVGAANLESLRSRVDRHIEAAEKNGVINMLLTYMVAEGNLRMVTLLVEEHGADLTLGPFWCYLTYIDFCATKGNTRVLRYILDKLGPEKAEINRLSTMTHIAAVDRASKSGMLGTLDILVEAGATGDFGPMTIKSLAHMDVMVAFCYEDYGEKTGSSYCSYYEVKYVIDNKTPCIALKLYAGAWPPAPVHWENDRPGKPDKAGTDQNKFYFSPSKAYLQPDPADPEACAETLLRELQM